MADRDILSDALKFHGHRCWASVAGVRVGSAALRVLGVRRSGGTQLYAVVDLTNHVISVSLLYVMRI